MRRGRWRRLLAVLAALPILLSAIPPLTVAAATPALPVRAGERVQQAGGGIEVEVVGDPIIGRPIEVEIRATNPAADANQGSITVSLPGSPSTEVVRASAPGAKVFQPGEPMFNFSAGRATPITVPAVELYIGSWPTGTRHVLRLRLTASVPYSLQARASFRRGNGSFVHLPGTGQVDQQGAPTRLIDIAPRQPAAPTVAPPRPTNPPPPPPPPTNTPVPAAKPTQQPVASPDPKPAQPPAPPPDAKPTQAPAPAAPPLGSAATPTPPPAPTVAPTPAPDSSGGPSMPLLLAGFGIMALGVATALAALLLVLRRRSDGGEADRNPFAARSAGQVPTQHQPPPWGTQPQPRAPSGWQPGMVPQAPTQAPSGPLPWERQQPPPQQQPPSPPPWGTPMPPTGTPPAPTRPHTPAVGGSGTPLPPVQPNAGGSGGSTPSGERYVDRQLMGRGGMGSVYRAYDSRLRRWVALKIMHADLGSQPGFLERFIREAQVAAMLEHPNIVTVFDIEPVGDSIQMVMSWIEGEDLQKVLERDGALPLDRVARLLDQIGAALDHAHLREQPVLHRDIKPSNIMIGPNERAILTDFGIARLMGDASLTQVGQMVGTPAYMAPEVVQGHEADGRADVYALGVVLFQLVTGRAPFSAETPLALLHQQVHTPPPNPRSVMPRLPSALDSVLMRALAKDPVQRFQTAGALARAFRSAVGLG